MTQPIALVDYNNFMSPVSAYSNQNYTVKQFLFSATMTVGVTARSNEAKALGIEMGAPSLSLENASPNRKSLISSRSFGAAVGTLHDMEEAVATDTRRAAGRMRRQALATAN